jgi:ABC-type multidrug transport system ATPase subunit
MEPAIEIRELTKQFGDITAVDHIDLQVWKGEIFGFLGPNARALSGKMFVVITMKL